MAAAWQRLGMALHPPVRINSCDSHSTCLTHHLCTHLGGPVDSERSTHVPQPSVGFLPALSSIDSLNSRVYLLLNVTGVYDWRIARAGMGGRPAAILTLGPCYAAALNARHSHGCSMYCLMYAVRVACIWEPLALATTCATCSAPQTGISCIRFAIHSAHERRVHHEVTCHCKRIPPYAINSSEARPIHRRLTSRLQKGPARTWSTVSTTYASQVLGEPQLTNRYAEHA
jgi:hypothetical protein